MNRTGRLIKLTERQELRWKLKLDLIVGCYYLPVIAPFFRTSQFINRSALKSRTVSFFRYLRSVILLISGLFTFWGLRRIITVNHAPRPSGSFIQGVSCSLVLLKVVNSLKTFQAGPMEPPWRNPSDNPLECPLDNPIDTLAMVRMG